MIMYKSLQSIMYLYMKEVTILFHIDTEWMLSMLKLKDCFNSMQVLASVKLVFCA